MPGMNAKYEVVFSSDFDKAYKKLDRQIRQRVLRKLYGLTSLENPADVCKPLTGSYIGLWRVRVGDYRVIVDIRKNELTIIALEVGHRSGVYKR